MKRAYTLVKTLQFSKPALFIFNPAIFLNYWFQKLVPVFDYYRQNFEIIANRILIVSILIKAATLSTYYPILYKVSKIKPKPVKVNPLKISPNYNEIVFKSYKDKLNLSGWLFNLENSDKAIIIVSGSEQSRIDPGLATDKLTKDLIDAGFSVLVFDFRGRGKSDYWHYAVGLEAVYDVIGAYNHLLGLGFKPSNIGILGASSGGTIAILALPFFPKIGGMVIDSAYTNIKNIFGQKNRGNLFFINVIGAINFSFVAQKIFKINSSEVKPITIINKFKNKKFLFIHGQKDKYISTEDAVKFYKASPTSDLWIVPNSGHIKAYLQNRDEYINKVTSYFNKTLN